MKVVLCLWAFRMSKLGKSQKIVKVDLIYYLSHSGSAYLTVRRSTWNVQLRSRK